MGTPDFRGAHIVYICLYMLRKGVTKILLGFRAILYWGTADFYHALVK
ncbi:hypothetical protein EVA_02338 [gut metagenome]|uniref:Uncharacterized protein n=1 Tax=gut metagenome TaxID=749906 RepID=J9D9Q8_9ZZZZ